MDEPRAETKEHIFLASQVRVALELLPLLGRAKKLPLSAVFPLFHAAVESTQSLLELADEERLRDVYVLARMIFETSLNACFIIASGKSAAERAFKHAIQRYIRLLDRRVEIAGMVFQITSSDAEFYSEDPGIQELLQQFSSKSGKEIPSWTPESTFERLKVVQERFGLERTIGLSGGLLLYRDASEIAHGTVYGSLFSYGVNDPHPDRLAQGEEGLNQSRKVRMSFAESVAAPHRENRGGARRVSCLR